MFFQNDLDAVVSEKEYLKCETRIISLIRGFYDHHCFAYFVFHTDQPEESFPAEKSCNALLHLNMMKRQNGCFLEVKDAQPLSEISILGIREIAETYLFFPQSRVVVIPDECKCIVLSETNLQQEFMVRFGDMLIRSIPKIQRF